MATWAKGIDFKNSTDTQRVGGIGIYGDDTTYEKLYLGLGDEPWIGTGLEIRRDNLSFNNFKLYHEGNKPSASDVGASPSNHTHGLLHDSLAARISATEGGWSLLNSTYNGFLLKSIRTEATAPNWILGNFSAGIAFGGGDTKAVISVAYNTPSVRIAGGNGTTPVWWMNLSGTSGKSYNLDSLSTTSHDHDGRYMRQSSANGYWGMTSNGDTGQWVRTTVNGIIPYQAGGSSSLGTSSWPFLKVYANDIYDNGVLLEDKFAPKAHDHNRILGSAGRPASADIETIADKSLSLMLSTSSMTTGKPSAGDGYIMNFNWDTNGGWTSQLFVQASSNPKVQVRGMNAGVWGEWYSLYGTNNKPSPSDIGAAPSSHTHNYLPLSGGTLTGPLVIKNSGDGATLLHLNSERGWRFQQLNTGSDTALGLVSDAGDKSFNILAPSKTKGINCFVSDTTDCSMTIDGYVTATKFNGSLNGNSATTTKLAKPVMIQIGNLSQEFSGLESLSWTLSDIGASIEGHTHDYIPLRGSSTISGDLEFSNISSGLRGIGGKIADNDYWRIVGGVTGSNAGYLEIATADDGTEPIYVRQYNSGKFVTLARTATLLDASGNTSFPGTVTAKSFSGNASSATRLETSRNITVGNTSKSFNGTSNVAWTLDEIGALALTGGTLTTSTFGALNIKRDGSSNGASIKFENSSGILGYIGMSGNVNSGLKRWTADTTTSYDILDSANYRAYVTPANIGGLALNGGTLTGNLNIVNTAPVLTLKNSNSTDVALVFDRGVNANWKIRNSSGSLLFESDYAAAKGSYYTALTLNYNSGNLIAKGEMYANGNNRVYHTGNKPSASDVGALATTGGTITGETTFNNYLSINAWPGYGTGKAQMWYNGNTKALSFNTSTVDIALGANYVYHEGRKPSPESIGAAPALRGSHKWTCQLGANIWSRILYVGSSNLGCSGIIGIVGTRSSVVYNALFSFTATHPGRGSITQLSGGKYSELKARLVADGNGNCFVELLDTADQSLSVTFIQTTGSDSIEKYTAITSGNTIPTGYTEVSQVTLYKNALNAEAIKVNGYDVYHTGNKPSASDVGAATATHNHSALVGIQDTRNTTFTPSSNPVDFKVSFQQNGSNGVSDGGTYYSLMHIPRWSDAAGGSGGYASQLIFTDNENIWYRKGTSATTWSGWKRIYHSGNFDPADYLKLTGGTLSGAINVSGESKFHNGTFTDPWSGTSCAIKATGHIATTGSIMAGSWIRTKGDTGWYSESYGGGWYMTDTSWIRAYNGKSIYTAGILKADTEVRSNMLKINDGAGTPHFFAGGGDNATWTVQNIRLNCWWGFGIQAYDNKTRILFNAREGNISAVGNVILEDGHSEGRVSGFEPNRGTGKSRLSQADSSGSLRIETFNNSTLTRSYVISADSILPDTGSPTLGTSVRRWGQIYSTSGSIATSDSKLKENIKPISRESYRTFDNNELSSYDFYNYIKDTNTYTFNYKKRYTDDNQTWLGVLADEIPDNIFSAVGMMSKTQEEYEKELAEKELAINILQNLQMPLFEDNDQEYQFSNSIVKGTDYTYRELRSIAEREIEEPIRMINTSAQNALIQEVLSMALNKIESLETELIELRQLINS